MKILNNKDIKMEKKYTIVINTAGKEDIQAWSCFAAAKDWIIKCLEKAGHGYGIISANTANGRECLFYKDM